MSRELEGKSALVTGASRGIGRAITLALAQEGADVLINFAAQREAAEAVAAEIQDLGRKAIVFQADVSQLDQVKAMIAAAKENFGRIDILVNNAGITQDNYLTFMTEEQWDKVVDTNLKGAFNCTKLVAKEMVRQKSGRIINISSDAGLMGDMRRANYCASKAGLIGLTKAAARELAGQGITVNAIAPGIIETDLIADTPQPRREQLLNSIPLGRFGSPEDVAKVVVFLASDRASYITGQVLPVDGGMRM